MIRKQGNKWLVLSKSGKKLGSHSTEKKAKAQLRAVEANKSSIKGHPKNKPPENHSQVSHSPVSKSLVRHRKARRRKA
jgi:hypothetical protein